MVQPPTTSGYYTQDSDCPTKRPTENDDDRSVQGQNENATNCFGMPLGAWLIVIAYTSIVCSVICAVGAILQLQMHSIFTRSYNIWPTTIYTYFLWFVFVVNVIFCVASSCLCADGRFGSRYCRLFFLVYGPVELLVSFGDIISCIVYVAAPKLFKAEDNLYPGIILSNSTIIFLYIMYVVALAVFLWQVWRARNMDPTGEERTRNWAIASRWIDRHTGSARNPVKMSNCLEENLTETTSLTASNETPVLQHQNVANVLQCRKFRLQAYHIIHKSKKSLDELITKIYNTMRKKFFVGEKVYRIDGSGVVYTVVEDVSSCFRTRYKVQSAAITTLEVVNFSEIVRPHHVSKTDLKVLIDLFARRENGQWIVRRHYVECLGIAKEPEVEIPAEVLKIEKELIQGCFV